MRNAILGKRLEKGPFLQGWGAVFVLCLPYACGITGGFFMALLGDMSAAFSEYLEQYLLAYGSGGGELPPVALIWDCVRWPLLTFILGISPVGIIGIPAILFSRGFLLSYAITVFSRLFSLDGILTALILFGVSAFLVVPVMFVIGSCSFRMLLERRSGIVEQGAGSLAHAAYLLPCAGLVGLAFVFQWSLMPSLLSAVCARIFML